MPMEHLKFAYREHTPKSRGPAFDFMKAITSISLMCGIVWTGFNFVHDTQALSAVVHKDHGDIALSTARIDRMDGNMQIIMHAMHLQPLIKTDTEIKLEHPNAQFFLNDTQSTNDMDSQ